MKPRVVRVAQKGQGECIRAKCSSKVAMFVFCFV